MTHETIFWIKWLMAFVGVVMFAVAFRAHARREHERDMDSLAKKELEKREAPGYPYKIIGPDRPVVLSKVADKYRVDLGRSLSPLEVMLDANRRMNDAKRALAERDEPE